MVISFMFPVTSKINGGVQSLIISYIEYFAKSKTQRIRLYDYSTGLIVNQLSENSRNYIDFICLDNHKNSIPNKGNEVFVLTDFLWQKYPYYFQCNNNVRLLMMDVFYPTWDSFDRIKNILTMPFLKKTTVNILKEKKGVCFIEAAGINKFNELSSADFGDKQLVPIPIILHNYYEKSPWAISSSGKLTIGYLGRAVKWKVTPFIKLIEDLVRLELLNKVNLVVYTNDKTVFKSIIDVDHDQLRKKVDIDFYENFSGDRLNAHVTENVNIGYAMGTAALLMASLKKPTILCDFSEFYFPSDYKYRWLYDAEKGNVGLKLEDVSDVNDRLGLDDLIKQDLDLISSKCYSHVKDNHDIERVASKLVDCCNSTMLKVCDLESFVLKQQLILYKIKRILRSGEKHFGWAIK
jgi:hypothetical protein